MAVAEERPLRADARRNRERIVKAAKAVFATKGQDAQMDDIARRAKVGVGTVYRHFPTKDALVRALMVDRITQIVSFAREGLENPDPWNGFRSALWRGAELGAKDRALSQLFSESGGFSEAPEEKAELLATMGALIRRAQDAGVVREDLRVEDIPVIMCGILSSMNLMGAGSWERHLSIVLDGLRASAAGSRVLPG